MEFRVLFGVENDSKLPLDLLGLDAGVYGNAAPGLPAGPRFVALGILPEDVCCLVANARPFGRLTLQPGELVQLAVVGRSGPCATSDQPTGANALETVTLVYEQLTIHHSQAVVLPDPVEIPVRSGCVRAPRGSSAPSP